MNKLARLILLFAVSLAHAQVTMPATPNGAGVSRYTLLLMGNKAGFETSSQNVDGTLQLYFEFNDRDRGPKVTEHIVLDKHDVPVQIANTGNDYLKAPVDEHFSLQDG